MLTKAFWKDAAERAVKTFAQTLLSLWLVGDVAFNLLQGVDWTEVLGVGLGGAVISLLVSVASSKVGTEKTASVVDEVTYEPTPAGGALGGPVVP